MESMKTIAHEIGESVYYTDDDIYTVLLGICREQYNVGRSALIPAQAKVEVARKLHYEYNASIKQIARMLKIERSILESLFPKERGQAWEGLSEANSGIKHT